MVASCAANNCTNRFKKNSGITFHKFPLNKPELLSKWLASIKRGKFTPTHSHRLCSTHFIESSFWKSEGKKILKDDAVPKLFNFPKHLKKVRKPPRRILKRKIGSNIKNENNEMRPGTNSDHINSEHNYHIAHSPRKQEKLLKNKVEANLNIINGRMEDMVSPMFEPVWLQDSEDLEKVKLECVEKDEIYFKEEFSHDDVAGTALDEDVTQVKLEPDEGDVLKFKEEPSDYVMETPINEETSQSMAAVKKEIMDETDFDHDNLIDEYIKKELKNEISIEEESLTSNTLPGSTCIRDYPTSSSTSSIDENVKIYATNKSSSEFTDSNNDIKTHIIYNCDTYGKRFSDSVRLHIKTVDKPYICELCGKSFATPSSVNRHRRGHSKAKPYKCHMCGKSFSQFSSMTRHSIIHTDESPFKCDICGKSFTCFSHLNGHMRTHEIEKPYICCTCGRKSTDCCHMSLHIKSHSGGKPAKCDVCGKMFAFVVYS